jgi:heme exporter protein A
MMVQPCVEPVSITYKNYPEEQAAEGQQKPLAVEIRGLKKSFGLKPVLRGIDLVLTRGELMAILGSNGAGKTTLLRLLSCLTKPSSGTIRVEGLDRLYDAQQVRQLFGFVGHQPYLYEELTALENLLFFARMYSVTHAQERARELLQRVGLAKRMYERAGTCSRGQLQRLAWARALLHSPRLLLLDEPDTGLDQDGQELIDTLLAEHTAQDGSIIFTTHQLERALRLADSVVLIERGRIAYQHVTTALTVADMQQMYREVVR